MVRRAPHPPGATSPAFPRPTPAQREWLRAGLAQPGGKLPLFDGDGQAIPAWTVRACVAQGWAQPWFANPLKPGWLVCRLTHLGRAVASEDPETPLA